MGIPKQMKQYLSPKELAQYINVSIHTIYYWIATRQIPFVKLGRLIRFNLAEIQEWLKSKKVEPEF